MKEKDVTRAYDILKTYKGKNNQILYYQSLNNRHAIILKEFDIEYILNNFDYEPQSVNKIVKISDIYGKKLQEKYELDFVPEKVRITTIIGEMGESYHCYLQFRQSIPPKLHYINKKYILNPLDTVDYSKINIDFDKFDKKTEHLGRKLKNLQKEGVKFLLANKKCILADGMGSGKQQDVNTLIPTPNGYKRLGDIQVGDAVFGSNGKPCNVISVFPQGKKDLYEIEFTDNSKTNCGLEHLWIVKDKVMNGRGKDWTVLSLKEIIKRGIEYNKHSDTKPTWKHNYKFRIPICQPVEYAEREHLIKPYLMGIMIGDGNLCNNSITISIPDNEIETVDRITNLINENYTFHENRSGACPRYNLVKKKEYKTLNQENIFLTEIRRLKINVKENNKFIPQEYMFDSIENRIELLRGLMDSDGTISKKNNKISYSTTSYKLANDIVELVQSLGGLSYIRTYDRCKEGKSIEYSVSIKIEICPFHLERKKNRYTITPNKPKYLVKSIKSIKLTHQNEAVCIKVDSTDESYLTNNYIVTHNTTTATVASICTNVNKILIICPASVKSTWKRELLYYVDEKDIQIVNGSTWEKSTKFTIINYDILDNFYTIPKETYADEEETLDEDGKVVKKLVLKAKKSTKKSVIEECMKNSKLFQENFQCVIVDEVHRMVNNKSIRYQVIEDLFKRTRPPFRFLLTGTPMTNKPMNLYYILKLINAEITDDYRFYVKRYCGGREMILRTGKKIMMANDATNLDELREKIKHIYIRRLLSQMTDMVKKNIEVKEYDLNEKQLEKYNKLWDEYVKAQEEKGVDNSEDYRQLVEGTIVRQYLAKEMIPNTIHLAEEILDNDEKVIISCTYTEEVNELKKHFGKTAVVYDGKMTTKQKDKSEYEFMNNPKIKVFIGQIDSASVGLTLTAATKLIFNSFSFSSHVLKQMEDRIYRLTQTKDVTCYYQVFTDSISQHVYNTVIKKELMANTIIKSENEK